MGKFLAPIRRAITYAIALLNVLAIISLKPLVFIRLQPLNVARIGHFLSNTEITLARQGLGEIPRPARALDVWLIDDKVSNYQVLEMYRRHLKVVKLRGGHTTRKILRSTPSLRRHIIDLETTGADIYGALSHTKSGLTLTEEETQEAILQAQRLGLAKAVPWICIANRDSKYLRTRHPGTDWSYHDYRNSSISNYVLAAESLGDLGFYVVRMGREVAEEIPSRHKRVVDYATSGLTSDLLDVYLSANCVFFLSNGSGIDELTLTKRRPRCYVNHLPFGYFRVTEKFSINITKHHLNARTGKPWTQGALSALKADTFVTSQQYQDADIQLQENSPEEIRSVALEMHKLMSNSLVLSEEDKKNQTSFWESFSNSIGWNFNLPFRTLIGPQFLRENPQWLQ